MAAADVSDRNAAFWAGSPPVPLAAARTGKALLRFLIDRLVGLDLYAVAKA